jgi:CPA2 family monovalent cation:H+ antiporter-2
VWWLLVAAVPATVFGKMVAGYVAGKLGGFTRRQSVNAGVALVAHGEFTVIIAQLAATNDAVPESAQADIVAFAGLYVLVTATVGIVLMKESKALGRRIFAVPRLEPS